MELITVFARRINGRVVIFKDALCQELFARFGPYKGPNRRSKTVMLNCWRWKVQWVG